MDGVGYHVGVTGDLDDLIKWLERVARGDETLALTPRVCGAIAQELRTSRDRLELLNSIRKALATRGAAAQEIQRLFDQLGQMEEDDTADLGDELTP